MVPKVDLHLDPGQAAREAVAKYGSGEALAIKYSDVLSHISEVLYVPPEKPTYLTKPPIPPTYDEEGKTEKEKDNLSLSCEPRGSLDPTLQTIKPFALRPTPTEKIKYAGGFVQLDGLGYTNAAIDPFLMQYTDGFDDHDVAWDRLLLPVENSLSEQSKLITLQIDIEMRLSYVSKVQSSNAATHVLRTMSQARYGSNGSSGVFGDVNSEIKVIISSDYYVAGLAGLLDLHWTLTGSGYQPDYCCSPNGTIVFELRKYKISKAYVVRAFYYAPTLGQLRGLTPLSLGAPPARERLKIDGSDEISFDAFNTFLSKKIDQRYVAPFSQVPPPGVLTDVPLK